jgi:hypothetical protein
MWSQSEINGFRDNMQATMDTADYDEVEVLMDVATSCAARRRRLLAEQNDATAGPLVYEEVQLLRENKWFAALRTYRLRTKCTLVHAKAVIDATWPVHPKPIGDAA